MREGGGNHSLSLETEKAHLSTAELVNAVSNADSYAVR